MAEVVTVAAVPARRRPGVSRRDFVKAGLSAVATPVLAGCIQPMETHSTTVVSSRLTARPGTPTATPTLGQSDLHLGSDRDGILYVPQSYSADTPVPLFVALHGAGGAGADWEGFTDLAETRGMVLLAPDSRYTTWDVAGASFGADIAFVDRALAYTFSRCRINPARIALAGFSDGASCALSLGLPNGDLFTHLVAYSPGTIVLRDAPVASPLVFVSHGLYDTVISESVSEEHIVPYLQAAGYNVVFQTFEGGHQVPIEIANASLDWFFSDAPPIPPQIARKVE